MKTVLRFLDLPRLALAIVFLALAVFQPLIDPDYFWHLATGEYLVQHGLPRADIFSYTHADTAWVLHEWLFEILLYGAHTLLGGEPGIRLLLALMASGTLAVMYGTACRVTGKPHAALLLALSCFILVLIGVSPRPQLVTLLLLAIYLRIMIGFKYFGETRLLPALPLLMLPWVNSHGGYVIGLAVLFFFLLCETVVHLFAEERDHAQKKRLRRLGLFTCATLLASLANPWLIEHWAYPFEVMAMEASRTYITEWRSPNFHGLANRLYLVMVMGFFVFTAYRRDKPDLTEVAMPLAFMFMGFVSIRHVPLAAIAGCVFMAVALSREPFDQIIPARWRARLAAGYERRFRQGKKQIGDAEFVINWLLLGILVASVIAFHPVIKNLNEAKQRKLVPVAAVDFILEQEINGRMFNTYHYGGYLIYRLFPAQKVFIDGRADMYGDDFVKEYIEISTGTPGWKTLFERHSIDYLLVQRSQAIRQLLLEGGDFRLVFDDGTDSVLVRNDPRYAAIVPRILPPGKSGP